MYQASLSSPPPLRRGSSLSIGAIFVSAGRFLATVLVTLFGLLVVTFLIGRVMPLDPVIAIVGDQAPKAVYDAAFRELGLDKPLLHQFAIYCGQVLSGDFGMSLLTRGNVADDMLRAFPATLELATIAIIIGVAVGVPLGVTAAANQNRWPDHLLRIISLCGYSMPLFWLAIMGLLIFYGMLGWVSGPGRVDIFYDGLVAHRTGVILIDSALDGNWEVFGNAFSHVVLPASLLGYYSLAYISRMTRSFMLEQLSQDYITTARVKGLSETAVIWRHAFGNILVPLITVIVLSYASLLEGSVLTEIVFSWPGLGSYITNALLAADMNAVLGGTLVVGAIFVTLNLLSDLLYRLVDPRAAQ